jgi:hypothetical protein
VSLGRLFRGQIVIPQIEMVEPVINLERDSQGRASWQLGTTTGAIPHIGNRVMEKAGIGKLFLGVCCATWLFAGLSFAGARTEKGVATCLSATPMSHSLA